MRSLSRVLGKVRVEHPGFLQLKQRLWGAPPRAALPLERAELFLAVSGFRSRASRPSHFYSAKKTDISMWAIGLVMRVSTAWGAVPVEGFEGAAPPGDWLCPLRTVCVHGAEGLEE